MGVGLRFHVNPELKDKTVVETEEMRQRTKDKLTWLLVYRPLLVLMPDDRNNDPNCVMVMAEGQRVANLAREDALVARAMMKAMGCDFLVCELDEVVVGTHGYFYMKKPTCSQSIIPLQQVVDWSGFQAEELLQLPMDELNRTQSLSSIIRYLLPTLATQDSVDKLHVYLPLWLHAIRFIQTNEVMEDMRYFVPMLAADEREEVRQMVGEINHICTKRGTPEMTRELVDEWWTVMLRSDSVRDSYQLVKARWKGSHTDLHSLLWHVNGQLQTLPANLYNDVGSDHRFFGHLGYLTPSIAIYQRLLSNYALRTLLCQELGISTEPFWQPLSAPVTNIRDITLTLGDIIDYKDQHTDINKLTIKNLIAEMTLNYYQHDTTAIAADGATQIGRQTEQLTSAMAQQPRTEVHVAQGGVAQITEQSINNNMLPQNDTD